MILYVVVAFRYGQIYTGGNVFPIGVFTTPEAAEEAAAKHHEFRGGKYKHRIYKFTLDKLDDDAGHISNNGPCIEDKNEDH